MFKCEKRRKLKCSNAKSEEKLKCSTRGETLLVSEIRASKIETLSGALAVQAEVGLNLTLLAG